MFLLCLLFADIGALYYILLATYLIIFNCTCVVITTDNTNYWSLLSCLKKINYIKQHIAEILKLKRELINYNFAFSFSDSDLLEDKRGFRNGASDRFSHGFGKRLAETVVCVYLIFLKKYFYFRFINTCYIGV